MDDAHGLPSPLVEQFIAITLTAVTASVLLHGVSVTPLMSLYSRRKARRESRAGHVRARNSGVKP